MTEEEFEECEQAERQKHDEKVKELAEEPRTIPLKEIGKVGTVSFYTKTYVDSLQKKLKELEKENKDLRLTLELERKNKTNVFAELNDETARSNTMLMKELAEAGEIMNIAIEGIKCWGIVGGTERPFEKQAEKLFNLFLEKAEDFIKE